MEIIGNLFNDSVYNLISVFSDPLVLTPVVVSILITFVGFLFFKFLGKQR